jgi:hypothetical protein
MMTIFNLNQVIGKLDTPDYGIFVSHKHPDGQASLPSISIWVYAYLIWPCSSSRSTSMSPLQQKLVSLGDSSLSTRVSRLMGPITEMTRTADRRRLTFPARCPKLARPKRQCFWLGYALDPTRMNQRRCDAMPYHYSIKSRAAKNLTFL